MDPPRVAAQRGFSKLRGERMTGKYGHPSIAGLQFTRS